MKAACAEGVILLQREDQEIFYHVWMCYGDA